MDAQAALNEAYDRARAEFIPVMSPECRAVLIDLLRETHPRAILEIGTAIGYSSALMLIAAPEATIDTLERDETRLARAEKLWRDTGVRRRVNAVAGDARQTLAATIEGKTYDFVFLDANKSAYLRQLKTIEPHLADGAVVIADDVLYLGLVKGGAYPPHKHRTIVNNMRAFLVYATQSRLYDTTIYERGGIAVIRKKESK